MQEEAKRFGDEVAGYLMPLQNSLVGYRWPMTKSVASAAIEIGLAPVDINGGYVAINALRADVAAHVRSLHTLPTPEREARLRKFCHFVIKTWGSLPRNQEETISTYVERFTNGKIRDFSSIKSLQDLRDQAECEFPFKGFPAGLNG